MLAVSYPESTNLISTNELSPGQLGIAMTGLSVGLVSFYCSLLCLTPGSLLVGSPTGGALYTRFSFCAPFIFTLLCAVINLFLCILIIERDVTLKWGYDPSEPMAAVTEAPNTSSTPEIQLTSIPIAHVHGSTDTGTNEVEETIVSDKFEQPNAQKLSIAHKPIIDPTLIHRPTPLLSVVIRLSQSPHALVTLTMLFVYG
jgi:DHA1 family solute carrier family 18 vesicular amine transporter 1/2